MLEGFQQHAKLTGQEHPLEMLQSQNNQIQASLDSQRVSEVAGTVAALKQKNELMNEEIKKKKLELLDMTRFYAENGPTHAKRQLTLNLQEIESEPDIEGRLLELQEEQEYN